MGVNSVISIDEMKMALFARSCTRCFGLTTLLANMVHPAPYHAALNASLSPAKAEYRFGVSHEAYALRLPDCCAKHSWRTVVGAVYARFGVILLGRVKLVDEDDPLAGEWLDMTPHSQVTVGFECYAVALAFSQSHLDLVSGMEELPIELYHSKLAAGVRPTPTALTLPRTRPDPSLSPRGRS